MITYFKNFTESKFAVLLGLLLLIRLPVIISGTPLTFPELDWMIVAERMDRGFLLYRDIWINLEPLSALVYLLVHKLFSNAQVGYHIFSLLLVFVQAVLINYIFNFNIVRERTMVPGLIYVVFSSLFFDFFTLSPPLLAITFLLVMVYYLMYIIKYPDTHEKVLYLGISICLATLFYFPSFVFILLAFIILLMYATLDLRKLLLLFTGFFFPLFIMGVFYYWQGGLSELYSHLILSAFTLPKVFLLNNPALYLIIAVPALATFLAVFIVLSASGQTNYVLNTIKLMILYTVFAGVSYFLFSKTIVPYLYLIFIIPAAFFVTHAYHLISRKRLQESSFFVILLAIILINFGSVFGFLINRDAFNFKPMLVEKRASDSIPVGKNIWVIGKDKNYYYKNTLAMPYYNMDLSSLHLDNMDEYNVMSQVYMHFAVNKPEVVVDLEDKMPEIFNKIPVLRARYELREGNIYIAK